MFFSIATQNQSAPKGAKLANFSINYEASNFCRNNLVLDLIAKDDRRSAS